MATRVAPRASGCALSLDEKLAGIEGCQNPVEEGARLGASLVLQQALEAEVTEFLGHAPATSAARSRSPTATATSQPP
jgi:hypothetical protein